MQVLQTKLKALTAFVTTAVGTLLALYNANQNVTLKQFVAALVAGVIGGAVVHQIPNKKE